MDVCHSDGFLEAWAGTATAGLSDLLAIFCEDLAMLADHAWIAHYETDPFLDAFGLALNVLGQLVEHIFTDELHTGVCRLAFEDGPHQSSFKRGDVGIDVMTMQAKTSLQPQGISRTKTCQLHCRILQQLFSDINHILARSRDLEAILTSVSRSSDRVINTSKFSLELGHKWNLAERHPTYNRLKDLCALRTLQGDQPILLKKLDSDIEMLPSDDFLEMLKHDVLIRPIDHNPNSLLTLQVRSNSVIDDASPLIKEHRKVTLRHTCLTLPAGVAHSSPLQQFDAIRSSDDQLPHMADIEDRRTAPTMQMLLDDSLRVVHRQIVTCELYDFSLLGDVQLLEAGVLAS